MTQEAKKFWGEVPRTPLEEDVSFGVHLTNTCMHFRARHYALSDFLAETRFDPWWLWQFWPPSNGSYMDWFHNIIVGKQSDYIVLWMCTHSQIESPPWSQAGFVRANLGTMGFIWARASPVDPIVPRFARTNPAWDQRGLSIWECVHIQSTTVALLHRSMVTSRGGICLIFVRGCR